MRIDRCIPAAGYLEGIGRVSFVHAHGNVGFDFLEKALAQVSEVTYLPSRPAKGESLTMKFIDTVGSSMCTKGMGSMRSGSQAVSPMASPVTPATATISRVRLVHLDAAQAFEAVEPRELHGAVVVVLPAAESDHLAAPGGSALDAAYADAPDVFVVIDRGKRICSGAPVARGRGDRADDGVEQRAHVLPSASGAVPETPSC